MVHKKWKTDVVASIYKKGVVTDTSNYRPISLTSVCCKLMESLIKYALLNYFLVHNLISKSQHGFLSRRSVATNLLESLNDWTVSINYRSNVGVAYIDFSKAFDSVCHRKL